MGSLFRSQKSITEGHFNIVKYVIEMNFNMNEKNSFGFTGFMHACHNDHLNIVKYLVEKKKGYYSNRVSNFRVFFYA